MYCSTVLAVGGDLMFQPYVASIFIAFFKDGKEQPFYTVIKEHKKESFSFVCFSLYLSYLRGVRGLPGEAAVEVLAEGVLGLC